MCIEATRINAGGTKNFMEKKSIFLKREKGGAGEQAQQLRALSDLAENLGPVPFAHVEATCKSRSSSRVCETM